MKLILNQISKWKIFLYVLLSLMYSIMGIATSIIVKWAGNLQQGTFRQIVVFGGGSILLYVFIFTVMYLDNVLIMSIIKEFNIKISQKSLRAYEEGQLSMSNGEITSFLSQDLFLFWQEYLVQIFIIPTWSLVIIVSIAFMLIQNLFVGALFAIGGLSMILPQILLNSRLEKVGNMYSTNREKSLEKLTDFTGNISMFTNNGAATSARNHTMTFITKSEQSQYKFFTTQNLVMFWTGPFRGLGEVIPFAVGLLLIQKGNLLTFPVLIALFTASQQLKSPLQSILTAFSSIQSVKGLKEKVVNVLALPTQPQRKKIGEVSFSKLIIENISIELAGKTIFKDLNLTVEKGAKILLIGKSGSGKSTLFKLIAHQLANFKGDIYLADCNGEKNHNLESVVSIIQQTPAIFRGTLRENLALFEDYSDQELLASLEQVNLVNEIPDILNFELTGKNLSGGQTMKLEIARALLRGREILLADEITAALDKENAEEIRNLLLHLPKTIIEIAHYYDENQYDKVYRLQDGKLIKGQPFVV